MSFGIKIFFIEIQLIYNVVLLSSVQQSASFIHIYIFFFRLFSIIGYYKILNIVPCATQYVLVYLFILFYFFPSLSPFPVPFLFLMDTYFFFLMCLIYISNILYIFFLLLYFTQYHNYRELIMLISMDLVCSF